MTRNLSTVLLLALGVTVAGCAADSVDSPDPGDDTNPMNPPPDEQPVPLTPEGTFSVTSDFDLAQNLPGTAGTIANYFIQATDDPDDPTRFIVQQLVNQLPAGSIKNTLNGAIPFVAGYLNDRLLEVAPDFVSTIVDVGNKFGQVAHHFGTLETLEINAAGLTQKTIRGLHFKVDNIDLDYAFADYQMQDIKVANVQVQLAQSGKLTIGEHKFPMKYGQVLHFALDNAIIPLIDPSASNLGDLLKNVVNCQAVGQYVYEAIGVGSPSTFQSACTAGLTAAGPALYGALDHIDTAALEFNLNGTARAIDKNKDGKMDDIATGLWKGELKYAGTPAALPETSKFFGTKM
jgi:hypothetical protein